MAKSDPRRDDAAPDTAFSRTLQADAEALRAATANVPDIAATAAALQRAIQVDAAERGGRWAEASVQRAMTGPAGRFQTAETGGSMKTFYSQAGRSRVATFALCTALLAGVLLWPVSYERTVGHTITLAVAGAPSAAGQPTSPPPEQVRSIAMRLKQAVGAGAVRVTKNSSDAPVLLTARVATRSRSEVERQLAGLTTALGAEHIAVTPTILARTEQHRGRVYAMALDKLIDIRIDTTGKSDSQVETEIRDQLTRSGVTPDAVQFQRTGSDESEANITAHDGDRELHIVRRQRGGSGELHIEAGGLDTERTPGMTDDELRDKIVRQLAARGLTATVTVHGDQVQIQAEKSAAP